MIGGPSYLVHGISTSHHCHCINSPHSRSHRPLQHKELDKLADYYWFIVSNSGLLLATVGSSRLITCIHKHFSSCDCQLWPMTLTFELYLDRVKVNHHAISRSEVIPLESYCPDTHTHTYLSECFTWTTTVVITTHPPTKVQCTTFILGLYNHQHWRRRLWATGARGPLDFQQFIFVSSLQSCTKSNYSDFVRLPLQIWCSSVAATRILFTVLFLVIYGRPME